jgi:hypothetical protein
MLGYHVDDAIIGPLLVHTQRNPHVFSHELCEWLPSETGGMTRSREAKHS